MRQLRRLPYDTSVTPAPAVLFVSHQRPLVVTVCVRAGRFTCESVVVLVMPTRCEHRDVSIAKQAKNNTSASRLPVFAKLMLAKANPLFAKS